MKNCKCSLIAGIVVVILIAGAGVYYVQAEGGKGFFFSKERKAEAYAAKAEVLGVTVNQVMEAKENKTLDDLIEQSGFASYKEFKAEVKTKIINKKIAEIQRQITFGEISHEEGDAMIEKLERKNTKYRGGQGRAY